MRKIIILQLFLGYLSVVCSAVIFFTAVPVYAETHITVDTPFQGGAVWTKSGSPYILDSSVFIPTSKDMYIGPGVTIIATSTPDNPISMFVAGNLVIEGNEKDHVKISGLHDLTLSRSTAHISYADIQTSAGLGMTLSSTTIASSTIYGSTHGVNVWASSLTVTSSKLTENDYGLYSYIYTPIVLADIFGKTAHADSIDNPGQNHIVISGSDLINNKYSDIFNATANTIKATNNWWGSSSGPNVSTSVTNQPHQDITGPVTFSPWLNTDPLTVKDISECCSSILFLPGFEASRLYTDSKLSPHGPVTTQKLWEPTNDDSVAGLFMEDNGRSINQSIYTKDILDTAFGFGVYKNFIDMMNGLVRQKSINTWTPFAYDWRFGIDSVISNSKLISTIENLASTSATGKVTIVAHSNGGLLAKMAVSTLAGQGKSLLIDKVILVAVPEIGTPIGAAALLHGDGQSLANGLVMDQATAREFGKNLPGAYGLLPSKAYFANIASSSFSGLSDPIISFSSTSLAGINLSSYGKSISTYDSFRSFLAGIYDHRSEPSLTDLSIPNRLHTSMLDNADRIHDSLDNFVFPSSTQVVSIIGWGNPTVKSIEYYDSSPCNSQNIVTKLFSKIVSCISTLEHTDVTTNFGDGTVIAPSAEVVNAYNSKSYYYDLYTSNIHKIIPDSHVNILNTDSAVALIKKEISFSTSSAGSLPLFISEQRPTISDLHEDNLVIRVHSPVSIDVYDSLGNHTGPVPDPKSDSGFTSFETNIPGSHYDPDNENVSITVPYGTQYKVYITGTGGGSFSLDTQRNIGDNMLPVSDFKDIPASPLLKAELVLATTTIPTVAGTSSIFQTATTSPLLLLDFDGDDIIDAHTTSSTTPDPTLNLESMRHIISSLHIRSDKEVSILKKVSALFSLTKNKRNIDIDAKHMSSIAAALRGIGRGHWRLRDISLDQKEKLASYFESILDSVTTN